MLVPISPLLFGWLMAMRYELHSTWLRGLVAGLAFAFLYSM